ncbi:MAG: tRNA preQ1(34) S-adenosylmethionine ribosyltransferase-isomerase QueA [Gammaproteobacteria bacterium]|nr:tRNA preQ1(34) S-adenosylmethionine ribosyltransferase-isomerase QueA [Gammaproteobacteria bacterium]
MDLSTFSYDLPEELIAQYPCKERAGSRLLAVDGERRILTDMRFRDIVSLLRDGDLLVMNDTRVIPARLRGRKASGGLIEVLVERILDDHTVLALLRASKSPRAGQTLLFEGEVSAVVESAGEPFYKLKFFGTEPMSSILWRIGHTPLPPYIKRDDTCADRERYQTVYARHDGAVAAPTAGLHFDQALLGALQNLGVELGFLTLHVGAGTFQPVRASDVRDHTIHAEAVVVSELLCDRVLATQQRGGRVVAVGTTTVRALETGAQKGTLQPFRGESTLFIYPGYQFKAVDVLVTNFHLPCSSLLMLVCAFGGTDTVLAAYQHAVRQRYRFYSYGDAMVVTRGGSSHAV